MSGPATQASPCASFRADCGDLWRSLPDHPFLRELAAGTLPLDRFRFFLEQDVAFLEATLRALGISLARARKEEEIRLLVEEAALIVDRELANERALLARVEELSPAPGARVEAPATVAYGGWLVATAVRGDAIDLLVALHPCVWSYLYIAQALERDLVEHPIYGDWVAFFAGADYAEAVDSRTAALDRLLAPLPERRLAQLSELFMLGTRLEVLFWDMAYSLKHWPDLQEVR